MTMDSINEILDYICTQFEVKNLYREINNEKFPVIKDNLNDINYDYKDSPEYLAKHIDILPMENRDEILFNLGGYLNHSLYFYNLTNKKKDIPIELLNIINKYFGSFSLFREEFIDMAMEVKGSGYTFLVMDKNNKLRIINTSNQDTPYYYGFTPIMTIDVWEHSYYLKYTYLRKKYLENIFDIIDSSDDFSILKE